MDEKEQYIFIIRYFNNELDREEKIKFYQLLKSDISFRNSFKKEYELKEKMSCLEYKMSSKMKEDIYTKVICQDRTEEIFDVKLLTKLIIDKLYQSLMPGMALGIINRARKG